MRPDDSGISLAVKPRRMLAQTQSGCLDRLVRVDGASGDRRALDASLVIVGQAQKLSGAVAAEA